jgi:signal transduction histidine kinase/ligand-binding sensor domain-containing protein
MLPIRLVSAGLGLRKAGRALASAVVVATFCCAPSSALNPEWRLYQYGHRAWKVGDTLPAGGVNSITQDAQGYLWLGTTNGLLRFDGVRFTRWDSLSGTPLTGAILSLLADRDGSLWIGTTDGLRNWDHQRLSSYAEKQREMVVYSMTQDRDGAVWFTPSLLSSHNDALVCEAFHSKLSCYGDRGAIPFLTPSLASTMDPSGTMWLAESEALIAWRNDSLKIYPSYALRNNTSQAGITALSADSDGSLLVGISKRGFGLGLQRFRNGRWTAITATGFDGSVHKITKLLIDAHHALWIGTTDEGLYRLYHGRADHFDSHSGLSGDFVVSLHEDREGSLWVGTSEGLDQFRDLAVQTLSRTVYPRAEEFDNLVTTPDGTLWIGGDSTLYTLPNGATAFSPHGKNVEGKQVTAIFGDRVGRVWIGVDNTLNLFRDGQFAQVRMTDGGPTGFIVSIAEETDGTLWALTTGPPRRILSIDPRTLRATPGSQANASKIVGDPHGGLWIGSNTGDILHLSNGTLSSAHFAHGSGARISQLSVTPDGELLAAGEFGLGSLRNGAAYVLGARNGLPCTDVSSFVFDARGDLWLYARCGLIRIDRSGFTRWLANPSAFLYPRVLDTADGFRPFSPPFEGVSRSADGRLWFNGLEALQVIDPAHLYTNSVTPPVHIESVRADFRNYAVVDRLRLPPLTRNVEIDYSALSFLAPEKVDFRYRLSGFDHEWHEVGIRRQAIYTNLGPGTYRFQVIASNNDGIWNTTGDALSFTIPPKFYQTNWFLAFLALIAMALIYTVFVVRLRVSTKLVEGRMNERLQERDRIARELHDTLLQGFQGIVLRLQGIAKSMPESASTRLALEETMDRADQILIEGRTNLLQLRSRTGASPGLAEQLKATIADLQLQKFIPCELSVQGTECALKAAVDEEVFAMTREALTNAFRHSGATAIRAELHFTNTHLSFRCSDNGTGLPVAVLNTGWAEGRWGLIGLQERAERLRARFVLSKNEPHGTVVEIVLQARMVYAR